MSVRSAVGITNNNSGQLGQQVSLELASSSVIPAGSPQTGTFCQITLDAGVWAIEGSVACEVVNPADFTNGYSEFTIQESASNQVISQATGTTKTTGETFNNSSNIYLNMSAVVNITASTSYDMGYAINYTGGSFEIITDGAGTGATTILKATRVA